jgi:hypothetical protein
MIFLPLAAALMLLASASAPAVGGAAVAAPSFYLEELIARSRELGLSDFREWHVLLHYRPDRLGGGVTSLADSPEFFRAPNGKTDPQAELEATLTSFFASDLLLRDGEHPQCTYIARYHWLDARLGFDRSRLPEQDCPRFEQWLRNLNPTGVTLIFPEAYMNNPSSMFGHTLLRIDGAPYGVDRERRDLLAYAVNFAADTGPDGGVLFAVKGLIGAYRGFFSVAPYYDKVREYSDWDSRDMWGYPLDLTREEVDRMLMHLWELRGVAFFYYFFDENCSYELLGLVEAARPGLDLRGRFGFWVIPVDTVREIVGDKDLSGAVTYRPSATTRLRHLAAQLSPEDQRLARAISDGRVDTEDQRVAELPEETRALVLTVAYDRLRLRLRGKQRPEERTRSLRILTARSRVPTTGEPGPPPTVPSVRPEEGHETARLSLGSGWRDGRFFLEARVRPAFHDLLDPGGGFTEGAQIDFLDTVIRYYPDENELKLHEVTLIDIVSLAERDEIFQPISWKFGTGMTSRLMPRSGSHGDLSDGKLWHTNGGAGLSVRPWRGALAYTFLEGTFDMSGKLQPNYALGAGASAGIFVGDSEDRWKAHLHARATRFVAGDTRTALRLGLDQRLRLTRNTALELQLGVERDFHETWFDTALFWKLYF